MRTSTRIAAVAAGAVVVLAGAAGVAAASGVLPDDGPLSVEERSQAVDAATAEVEGEVVDTEAGDDGAEYGVEVRRPDGTVVEVELDANFTVVGTEADDEDSFDDDDTFDDDDDTFDDDTFDDD
jgi:hypothetical protein